MFMAPSELTSQEILSPPDNSALAATGICPGPTADGATSGIVLFERGSRRVRIVVGEGGADGREAIVNPLDQAGFKVESETDGDAEWTVWQWDNFVSEGLSYD
jgi:hypothetical protein